MKTLAFFNPKAGVGKTTLVYHLAHMYADLGVRTLVVDLDPQADLSCLFLTDEQLESLWPGGATPKTVAGALEPLLIDETTDLPEPPTVTITPRLGLLPGDLALTLAEDELNSHWTQCLDDPARSLLVEAAVWRLVEEAATTWGARLVLVDLGPNLTALNRAALLAAQYVAVPLAPDPFSLRGLRTLGPTLARWRAEWEQRKGLRPKPAVPLPGGELHSIGYLVLQHATWRRQPVRDRNRWLNQIPATYREAMLSADSAPAPHTVAEDPHCLAFLKSYPSLLPMAQQARKPMFSLKPADGALGGHGAAVADCYRDFEVLARRLADRCGVDVAPA